MNFVSWFREIVYSSNVSLNAYQNYIYVVFGCVLVCMVVAFIFKFLLKLMD